MILSCVDFIDTLLQEKMFDYTNSFLPNDYQKNEKIIDK